MDISNSKNKSSNHIEILDESTGQIILKQATIIDHDLIEQLTDEDDNFNDLNTVDLANDCETCMIRFVSKI
jgi:hypothetical protein